MTVRVTLFDPVQLRHLDVIPWLTTITTCASIPSAVALMRACNNNKEQRMRNKSLPI